MGICLVFANLTQLSLLYLLVSSPSTGILRIHNVTSSHTDGLIAQLVEDCIAIAEVMGLNPVQT